MINKSFKIIGLVVTVVTFTVGGQAWAAQCPCEFKDKVLSDSGIGASTSQQNAKKVSASVAEEPTTSSTGTAESH